MVQSPAATDEVDAYQHLIEEVIAGRGLASVARLLAEMLGLPAVVGDEELETLSGFAPDGRQLSSEETALVPELRTRVHFDLSEEPAASTAPPTLHVRDSGAFHFAVAPIVLPSGIVGYVWVIDSAGKVSDRAAKIVSHAAAACAVEMVRQQAIMEGEARVRNSFLEDLLTGSITSSNSARRRARFLGYDLRGEHRVFLLDIDHFVEYIGRHHIDEQGIQRLKERFRRSVDTYMPGIWTRTMIWEHSDSIIVLAPAGRDRDPAAVVERVEELRDNVQNRLSGPSISAAVGRAYSDLTRLKQSLRQAEHALVIGAAVNGPSSTTNFDDLGAYRLLFHLREQPELESFCEETIGPLVRYDGEHDSHLLETLSAFLELQGNLSQAARALHLHRNGLLYRLSRIEKTGGFDLDNPSQRLALQIALLARPLLLQKNGTKVSYAQRGERR
ncbi:MAG: PucR family transcriptional regulator [Chloroflexota bacterium]|nr:MAG: hypothetical protein DLM70_17080 [Chloroflexota bacterium]